MNLENKNHYRIPDPWHSKRLDLVANLVHAAIV